jgi:hypothetical protein
MKFGRVSKLNICSYFEFTVQVKQRSQSVSLSRGLDIWQLFLIIST